MISREDFQKAWTALVLRYSNKNEIVTVEEGAPHIPGEGNGLLQTGLAYSIKVSMLKLTDYDCFSIEQIALACKHRTYWFFWRSPYKKNPGDNQKLDDYWGLLAMLYHAKSSIPWEFYQEAERCGWYVDIQNPGKRADLSGEGPIDFGDIDYYFERFPGFKVFAKMAARGKNKTLVITLREHLEIFLVGLYKAWKPDTSDGLMRDYCFFSVVSKESLLGKIAAQVWLKRARSRWGSIGKGFEPYFKGASHPLTWYDWEL